MKRVIFAVAILLASASFSTTALSDENRPGMSDDFGQYKEYGSKAFKDECLIVAKNCVPGEETAMQRVERLQREIDKGAAVYTPEELKNLQDQLNWIYSESGEFSGGS